MEKFYYYEIKDNKKIYRDMYRRHKGKSLLGSFSHSLLLETGEVLIKKDENPETIYLVNSK